MSQFIAARSDQLNSDDLIGGPRTITVTGVRGSDNPDQPVSVSYEGDGGKPFKPCKSMRRVMVAVWGKYTDKYVGKSMTLYRDPEVAFGGMKVGGIRISHMSDIAEKKQMALTATRGKKGLYTVQPLKDAPQQQTADYSETLTHLRALARPGNIAALQSKWQDIGPDARKALANELQALKDACQDVPQPKPADDDVAFDTPSNGGGYDGV